MKIGALQKLSLIDFPGKLSAVVGTQGCNMHCFWCHNAYLIPYEPTGESKIIEAEAFFNFLAERKKFIEAVAITGGEPTIHSDLPAFCERIKAMGFFVKLDTNGTRPKMLNVLIRDDLIDYIAMDIKTDLAQYPRLFRETIEIDDIVRSINLLLSSLKPYEFRTTCVSPFVSLSNIDEIGALITGARQYYLQKCIEQESVNKKANCRILNENDLNELKKRVNPYVMNCEIR